MTEAKIDRELVQRIYERLAHAPATEMATICAEEMAESAGEEIRELRRAAHISFALSRLATDIVLQAFALQPEELLDMIGGQFVAKIGSDALLRLQQSRAAARAGLPQ